jgi:hypothetical protein
MHCVSISLPAHLSTQVMNRYKQVTENEKYSAAAAVMPLIDKHDGGDSGHQG